MRHNGVLFFNLNLKEKSNAKCPSRHHRSQQNTDNGRENKLPKKIRKRKDRCKIEKLSIMYLFLELTSKAGSDYHRDHV